jgi:hypothetical protein
MNCYCGAVTVDAYLCGPCLDAMRGVLRGVPDLLTELGTTTARLDRTQAPGVGSGGTKIHAPEPINTTTHLLTIEIQHLVTALALHLRLKPSPLVAFDIADHLHTLIGKPYILDYRRQLTDAITRATAAIDLPADTVRLGRCGTEGCGDDLIAEVGATWVRCGTCGAEYDVARLQAARKFAALNHLHDKTATMAQAGRIFGALGIPITERVVRAWAGRDTLPLVSVGRNLDGRVVFRLGSIIDEWQRKRA